MKKKNHIQVIATNYKLPVVGEQLITYFSDKHEPRWLGNKNTV